MIEHISPISGVDAFGEKYVATAGYDNQVLLWDATEKVALARVYHDHLANQCRFSSCGRYLVTASSDHTARVWSLPNLHLVAVLSEHKDDVEMAAISPTTGRIATASRDFNVRIFNLAGKLELLLAGHQADVISVEWLNEDELVSSSDDGTVRRWNAQTGELIETIDFQGIETDTIALTREGVIFAGTDEGKIISVTSQGMVEIKAHDAGIKRLVYDGATHRLLSASYDRTIKLWNVQDGGQLQLTHESAVPACVWLRSCAFAGKSHLVFGSFGSSYISYDLNTQEWDLSKVRDTLGVNAVLTATDGVYTVGDAGIIARNGVKIAEVGSLCNFLAECEDIIVTGGHTGELFNAVTGEVIYQHWSPLNCAVSFRKGEATYLLVGAYTGEGILLEYTPAGLQHFTNLQLHDNAIKGVACNGQSIFSVCATGAAAFHSVATWELEQYLADAHEKISNGADSLKDGRFVSISRDRKLRLWDGKVTRIISTPHTHSIKCVRVSLDGNLIATGAYNGAIWVYDLRCDRWVHGERPTSSGISSLTVAEGNTQFLASAYDGRVYQIAVAV